MTVKRVAIIDNELELAETLCQFISTFGYHSKFFSNAEDFLMSLKTEPFDVIVCELNLPGKSGLELFDAICSQESGQQPRIILMSGSIDQSNFKDFYAQGVDEVIKKPFDLNDITAIISMLLENDPNGQRAELKFFPVGISEFINSNSPNYDVYLKIDSKFICIAKSGQPLTSIRIEQLKQKNVKKIFLQAEDFLKYSALHSRLTTGASLSKFDLAKRKKMVGDLVNAITQSPLLKNNTNPILEKAIANFESVSFALSFENSIFETLNKLIAPANSQLERTSLQSFLSSAAAHSWGWNSPKLQGKIILAGLICDIGMRELPLLIPKKRFEYQLNDLQDYESHPERSAKILESIPGIPHEIITIARQHHENDSGRGFPHKIKKDQLHPVSRMIHVISEFLDLALLNPSNLELEKNLEVLVGQRILYSNQVIKFLYQAFNIPVHSKFENLPMPDQTIVLS